MGSVIDAGDDFPIPAARLIFQIDTVRYHQRLTDDVGFFLLHLPPTSSGKLLKYFIQHEKHLAEKGAYVIQPVNDPLTIRMKSGAANELKPALKIDGCVKSQEDGPAVVDARVYLRIGEIILPDTLTDENGCFSIPLTPDDLGKVVTYRILKDGFSPRFGYASIAKDIESIDIVMQKWQFTLSGYVKDDGNGKPVQAARVVLDSESEKPIVKLTSRWGFFTHTFTRIQQDHVFKFRIEKDGYQPSVAELEPKNDQKLQLDIKLRRLGGDRPLYKNGWFWLSSVGTAALATTVYIIARSEDEETTPEDLPFPPIPPENR